MDRRTDDAMPFLAGAVMKILNLPVGSLRWQKNACLPN